MQMKKTHTEGFPLKETVFFQHEHTVTIHLSPVVQAQSDHNKNVKGTVG